MNPIVLPMEAWPIVIKDHHEGYITWEDYLDNQRIIKQNQTNNEENMLPLSAREGFALLQGLLICGFCGYRLSIRYKGNGGVCPQYECTWKKREGIDHKSCFSVNASSLDQAISQKVLTAVNPAQIDIAIKAFEELEKRNQSLERHCIRNKQKTDRLLPKIAKPFLYSSNDRFGPSPTDDEGRKRASEGRRSPARVAR